MDLVEEKMKSKKKFFENRILTISTLPLLLHPFILKV